MTTATPRPKPMAPKKPAVSDVITSLGTITVDDLKELRDSIYGKPAVELVGENVSTLEKPKFIVKPHLTERPLKGHDGLTALRQQLESETPKRSGQNRTNKEKK